MKPHLMAAIGLLATGCAVAPPLGEGPVPTAPSPAPPAPRLPAGEEVATQEQKFDLTIIAGPESMAAGGTAALTARVMAPPDSQVIELQATPGKDAYTYALKLAMRVPLSAGTARPLEVQIPFTPPAGGTYYLDSARRYAIQVTPTSGYAISPSTATRPTTSFLDRREYTGGAYVPGGTYGPGTTVPSSTDSQPKPLFGEVVPLTTLTAGAIPGNAQVAERNLLELQGPRYGRRGERLRFTASLWTAGTGPIRPDLVQDGFEIKVSALLAPAEREPIGAPMPRMASMAFSWIFQDPGLYRLQSQNGITLGTVQIY